MLVDKLQTSSYFVGLACRLSLIYFQEPPVYLQFVFLSFEAYKLATALIFGFPQRYVNLVKNTKLPFGCEEIPAFLLRWSILLSAVFLSCHSQNILTKRYENYPIKLITPFYFFPNLMLCYGAFRMMEVYYNYCRSNKSDRYRKKSKGLRVSYQMMAAFISVVAVYSFRQEPWASVITAGLVSALEVMLPVTVKFIGIENSHDLFFSPQNSNSVVLSNGKQQQDVDVGFVPNIG